MSNGCVSVATCSPVSRLTSLLVTLTMTAAVVCDVLLTSSASDTMATTASPSTSPAVASPLNKSRDTLPQGWLNDQAVLTASNPAQSLLLQAILQDDPRSARSDNFVALPPRPTRVSANVGHSRVLECDVRYTSGVYVQHIVTWRKHGLEAPIFILFDGYPPRIDAPYQGRLRSVGPASVELSDIRLSDEGWYECSVLFMDRPDGTTNDNGTWIHLSVNVIPVLTDASPSLLIQRQGDNVDMFCEARATPTPTLTWLKDGRELMSSGHVTVAGRRVQLKGLTALDAGLFTCRFSNDVGTISHHIKLVIQGSDWISSGNVYIMSPPRNTTAMDGSRVRLGCHADGYPDNITYRWYRNGVDVQTIAGLLKVRGQIHDDGSLTIDRVTKYDSGWYRCKPTNGVGSAAPEADAYLNITYLPQIISMPERLYLARAMLGRIECPVDANPPLTATLWSKDSKSIEFHPMGNVSVNKQGTLLIDHVSVSDEGQYSCTPYSALGAGQTSIVVHVFVRDPPHFVLRPRPIYQRQPTQSVTLPCLADGDPKPVVTWRKSDGTWPVSTKVIHHESNLTVITLGKEDHGVYECVASNVVASVVTTSLLIIELSSPHPPSNVTVTTTQTSAKVSWQPAYDGGFPQHYVVWLVDAVKVNDINVACVFYGQSLQRYRPVVGGRSGGSKADWRTLRVAAEVTSLTVYQLRPETPYEFAVLARNRVGNGMFSDVITARTKERSVASLETANQSTMSDVNNTPSQSRHPPDVDIDDDDVVDDLNRPARPQNLTVRSIRNNLLISWHEQAVHVLTSRDPRHGQSVRPPTDYYVIQYRTVGRWVPLTERVETTSYNWTTASRGATYQFRVIAYSEKPKPPRNWPAIYNDTDAGVVVRPIPSLPSQVAVINTGDPMTESGRRPDLMIAGVVGGTLSAVCGIFALVVVLKLCLNHRRHRHKDKHIGLQLSCTQNDTEPEVHYDNHVHQDEPLQQTQCQQTEQLLDCKTDFSVTSLIKTTDSQPKPSPTQQLNNSIANSITDIDSRCSTVRKSVKETPI